MTVTREKTEHRQHSHDQDGAPSLNSGVRIVLAPRSAAGLDLHGTAELIRAVFVADGADPWLAPTASGRFGNFEMLAALFDELRRVLEAEAPHLIDAHDGELRWLARASSTATAKPGEEGVRDLATSIVFAVVRRISRESHHSAIHVDRLARLLLEAHRQCPSLRRARALIISDLELWDRPSIRCLVRAAALSTAIDRLVVAALAAVPALEPDDGPVARVAWCRRRFLERLAEEDGIIALPPQDASRGGIVVAPVEEGGSDEELFVETGSALGFQNYERVYLLCRELLARAADDEARAQAHRLVGIAHAQLGDLVAAATELDSARALTSSPTFAAHLDYLQGLICTKRHYDLAHAMAYYKRGLAALEHTDAGSEESDVERSWLLNGRALVLTLEAKQTTSVAQQAERRRESLSLELQAYELVKHRKGPAASYLRHNLLANMTFLLEISGSYDRAVEFWQRAFERFLATDDPAFGVAFDGRLGMLLFKAGRGREGLEALQRARQQCQRLDDPFYEERICLALGVVAHGVGERGEATKAFSDGVRIATAIRDCRAAVEQLSGLLWTTAESGDRELFASALSLSARQSALAASARRIESGLAGLTEVRAEDLTSALEGEGIGFPIPSPKMPSYIPLIDLEGTPERDLNRYLVSEGGPLLRGAESAP